MYESNRRTLCASPIVTLDHFVWEHFLCIRERIRNRYTCAPTTTRSWLTTVCVLLCFVTEYFLFLWDTVSFFPSIMYYYRFPFVWRVSCTFSFRMVFFYRWMSSRRYTRELYDRPKASLPHMKARMMKYEVVETLVYGCAPPLKRHNNKLRATHHRILLKILGA